MSYWSLIESWNTSIGLQLHNLKKVPKGGVEAKAIDAVRTGDFNHLKNIFQDNPLAIVGDVARGALIAAPGHKLRVTRKVRNGKKEFPQERWEDGKWKWGKVPKIKIPYRLPELIASPKGEPVFICEGEKDAENVAALGFVATSNPGGGIPKAWTNDLNKWFLGRTVFICEDHDKTGRNHENEVARALKGTAVEIRIVEFHELPEHGDVSLWLEHGGTAAQLLARARAGRLPSKGYTIVWASAIKPRNIDWLWENHLPCNSLELLAGVPGAGKSQIQDGYAACVTTGVSWPDGANGQGRRNVIMMTAEDVLDDTLVPRLIAAGVFAR
jgi:5S rRNA maturation endonuclease (ribonuclease M5)